jgi:uncharacterized protein YqiB (DUF1249 family)
MVSFVEKAGQLRKPRLKRLQQIQEEIYRQLQLLMPDSLGTDDAFQSKVNGSPVLHLEVLERHPYTHFLRLTYLFDDDRLAPDAHIRLYQDVRMAEVTAFNAEQGCKRTAHPWYPNRPLLQRLWRENMALDKWLGYLLQQGHSFETMRPAQVAMAVETGLEMPVSVA